MQHKKWKIAGILLLFVLCFLFVVVWQVRNAILGPGNGHYFDSDGVRIFYTDEGQGTPLVLLHGFAGNGYMEWKKNGVAEKLSQHFRVIVPDQRGHGRSDKLDSYEQYGTQLVEDVVRLLDHLNIDKAHVVGYSMGGFVTLKLISMYPDRLLSACPCGAGWEEVNDENMSFGEAVARALERHEGFGPLGERLGLEEEPPTLLDKIIASFVLDIFNKRTVLAAVMRGMHNLAVPLESLETNSVPVLTIIGSKDGLLKSTAVLVEKMANYTLTVIEGTDHITTVDAPEFLQALTPFLKEHTSGAN